jgi:hypothetical protein
LISEEAAMHIARLGLTISEVYKASEDVVRMRLNVSNAVVRARRTPASAAR